MNRRLLFLIGILAWLTACQPSPIDPPPPSGGLRDTTIKNISYGANSSQVLDLGLPAGRTSTTTNLVIVIHGGGWATGDKSELSWLLNGMKARGYAVANINYRLTLNSTDNFKMQLDDVDSAIRHVLRLAPVHQFNGTKLFIAGHSAGGHLAISYACTRNSPGMVRAAASLAGPMDLFAMSYYNFNYYNIILQPYLGMPLLPLTTASEQRYKNCSPRYLATAATPPVIFFHGEMDPVVFTDQSSSMATTLGALGVDKRLVSYPLTFHDWWTDAAKTANTMDEMKTWFTTHP